MDYVTPDEAFTSHQRLPQPLPPGEPSEWINIPEPTESITSDGDSDSDSVYEPDSASSASEQPEDLSDVTEDEQPLEISGFQNLPCCKRHRVSLITLGTWQFPRCNQFPQVTTQFSLATTWWFPQ